MKTWIVMLVVLVCASVSLADDSVNLWVLGEPSIDNQNNEVGALVGFRRDNVEIGIAGLWRMFGEADTEPSDEEKESEFALGAYGLFHLPEIIDVNNPIPIPGLPDKIMSEPYVGLKFLKDVKGKGTSFSPVTGMRIFETIGIMYEYRGFHGIDIPDRNILTLSLQIPF